MVANYERRVVVAGVNYLQLVGGAVGVEPVHVHKLDCYSDALVGCCTAAVVAAAVVVAVVGDYIVAVVVVGEYIVAVEGPGAVVAEGCIAVVDVVAAGIVVADTVVADDADIAAAVVGTAAAAAHVAAEDSDNAFVAAVGVPHLDQHNNLVAY